jgi:hypothetical protein
MGAPAAWSGLGPAQAKGRACVICAQNLATGAGDQRRAVVVMVGRCSTGSPVFACPGVCATRAISLTESRAAARAGGGGQR